MIKRAFAVLAAMLSAALALFLFWKRNPRTIEELDAETKGLEDAMNSAISRSLTAEDRAKIAESKADESAELVDARTAPLKRIDGDQDYAKNFNARRARRKRGSR